MTHVLQTTDGLVIALDREIGSGAVGRVEHGRLEHAWGAWPAGTEVALKRLHTHLRGDLVARRSLELEAEVAREAQHPALVRHLAGGEDEQGPYTVTEFLPGRTLRELLVSTGTIPEPVVRAVATRVAGALATLHRAGFVHADLKPENIRFDQRGEAVLMDLGFAQRVRPAPERANRSWRSVQAVAPEGMAMPAPELAEAATINPGSLAYLSPERARGLACEPASDVFALGVVLYELAAGLHPFAHDPSNVGPAIDASGFSSGALLRRSIDDAGADRLLAAIATARFVPPSRLVPQLSPLLDALLGEMLKRDPAARPNAETFIERFGEGESGTWWREQLDFGSSARRGTLGEQASPHLTPLVGREHELEQLVERCRRTFVDSTDEPSSGGHALWLSGPSGSGKSRLMSDCATTVRTTIEPPPLYLYARCPAFEEHRPCMPILRLLERYLRLPSGADVGLRQREQLARIVPPRIATTLIQALTPTFTGTTEIAVPSALAQWLVALGRSQPLLVFLDDLNFADEGSLDVLAQVAAGLGGARSVLVFGVRDDEEFHAPAALTRLEEHLTSPERASRIVLAPLDEHAVEALVQSVFHHSQPRRRIAQVLFARSRGNPGMLAEILRGLIDRGDAYPFEPHESKLVLSVPPERLPLPDSLQTMIQERFHKASNSDREWLQRLSVVGGRIETAFLLRAFPDAAPGELDAALARLVRTGWLAPTGDRYRFARPALREAVYRSLGSERRRRLHAHAADALLPGDPGESGRSRRRIPIDDAFQRAFHLRAAERRVDLLRVLRPLVQALLSRGQPQRVYVLARWGVDALEHLTPNRARNRWRIEFLEAAADASDRLGNRGEQRQWLDKLSDLELDPTRDPDALSRVYLLHARYASSTGQYGLARGMLRNAVELARNAKADELVSEALRRLGAVQAHVGELDEARKLLEEARDTAVHGPQRAVACVQLGIVHLLQNKLELALRNVDEALRLQRRRGRFRMPGISAAAHMLRGRIYRVCGRPARALGSMKRAVELARQAGERRLEAEATARLGGLLLDLNQPEEAEARLREALLTAREIEDRRGQTLASLWLGTLLWEQEDPQATALLDRALSLSHEMGLQRAESLALALRSRIAREESDLERAAELSEHAQEILTRQGAELSDRIVVAGTRALVLESIGREEEARAIVAELRRIMRRDNEEIENAELRRVHASAAERLLDSVLSAQGVVYPRVEPDASESDTEVG